MMWVLILKRFGKGKSLPDSKFSYGLLQIMQSSLDIICAEENGMEILRVCFVTVMNLFHISTFTVAWLRLFGPLWLSV
jgi:hypothetical protein